MLNVTLGLGPNAAKATWVTSSLRLHPWTFPKHQVCFAQDIEEWSVL